MTDRLPKAIWSGSFSVLGVDVKCHVLDNGQRIIDSESIVELFDAHGAPRKIGEDMQLAMTDLAAFCHGKGVPND